MKIKRWHIAGVIFTSLVGSLLHFVYDWSGGAFIAALFTAVNESTWEHLKLLVFPYLLFSLIEYFVYGKQFPNFFSAKFFGVLAGMLTITVLFYTVSGVFGKSPAALNIAIFILGVIAAYLVSFRILKSKRFSSKKAQTLSVLGIVLLIGLFFFFSFYPPKIGLFKVAQPTYNPTKLRIS